MNKKSEATVICPNCGANTSDLYNCEYCGSFLVQKARQGVDMTSYRTIATKYKHDGLLRAIKDYMDKIHSNPRDDSALHIYSPTNDKVTVSICNNRTDEIAKTWACDGVFVYFSFFDTTKEEEKVYDSRLKISNVYKVFTPYSVYEGDDTPVEELDPSDIQYYANFGFDADGACQVVLQLLEDIYQVDIDKTAYGDEMHFDECVTKKWEERAQKEKRKQTLWIVLIIVGIILWFVVKLFVL